MPDWRMNFVEFNFSFNHLIQEYEQCNDLNTISYAEYRQTEHVVTWKLASIGRKTTDSLLRLMQVR